MADLETFKKLNFTRNRTMTLWFRNELSANRFPGLALEQEVPPPLDFRSPTGRGVCIPDAAPQPDHIHHDLGHCARQVYCCANTLCDNLICSDMIINLSTSLSFKCGGWVGRGGLQGGGRTRAPLAFVLQPTSARNESLSPGARLLACCAH